MNCLIVDDEPLAIELIEGYIEKVPFLNHRASCHNAIEALEIVQKENIDLMFLDIQMPNLTGIEFLKSLTDPPQVIFTTAYSKYALDGFDLNATDYLVKPIPIDRFIKAVNRAQEIYKLQQNSEISDEKQINFMLVKADYSVIKIDFEKILYIEGLKDYLKIFVADRKPVLTLSSFKKIEEKLPSHLFIRVHRSYIVAINKIEAIQRNRIIIDGERIPIGDNYKENFAAIIRKYNLS